MSERGMDSQTPTAAARPGDTRRKGELRIARAMRDAGHIHQAIHLLTGLLGTYPQDAESRAAMDELMSLATYCEQQGRLYTALHLYRELEHLQ